MPSLTIIQNIRFLNQIFGRLFKNNLFLRKNLPIIAIIPNIRFLNQIFGRVFRLFKIYFFLRKNLPIIAIIPNIRLLNQIFGRVCRLFIFKNFFSQKKHADYCDHSECSVSKLNIRRIIRLFKIYSFF